MPASATTLLNTSRTPKTPGTRPTWRKGPTVWEGVRSGMIDIRRCRVVPSENNIEDVAQSPFRLRCCQIETADHPLARLGVRHGIEDRVERKQGVARKVHLGDEARKEGRS